MTFKQWAKKDENDIRPMHVSLETNEDDLLTFEPNCKITYSMMFRLQDAKVKEARLICDEWFIDLIERR